MNQIIPAKLQKSQVLGNIIFYSLATAACSLLVSYPYWLPCLCSSIKHFLFSSIPNVWSSLVNPKSLFVVGNVIVAFLVGESKIVGPRCSSPIGENLERKQSVRSSNSEQRKEEDGNRRRCLIEESTKGDEVTEVKEREIEEEEIEEEQEVMEGGGEKEEDEAGLPAEELHKRVEEFIARVNKQRWLEAKEFV